MIALITKLAFIFGWGLINLSTEGIKAYNLRKQTKIKEDSKKKKTVKKIP